MSRWAAEPRRALGIRGVGHPAVVRTLMLCPQWWCGCCGPGTRESLDGFVIGALGAIAFTAAATLTRLAPQFATGPTAQDRPVSGLLAQAGIQGVAVPLTAAAVGGLVGVALWFTRPADRGRRPAFVLLAVECGGRACSLRCARVDGGRPLLQGLHLGLHLFVAMVALLALRIGIQAALLHETHDEMNPGAQVLCPHCDHVVPDMAFCPNCGVAARAASRTSRTKRRSPTGMAVARPGYALPDGSYEAVPVRHHHTYPIADDGRRRRGSRRRGSGDGGGIRHAGRSALRVPARLRAPPIGKPVETNPWFTSIDGRFSVQYPRAGTAYQVTFEPDGVEVNFTAGDTGTMQFFGMPAQGARRSRSPSS